MYSDVISSRYALCSILCYIPTSVSAGRAVEKRRGPVCAYRICTVEVCAVWFFYFLIRIQELDFALYTVPTFNSSDILRFLLFLRWFEACPGDARTFEHGPASAWGGVRNVYRDRVTTYGYIRAMMLDNIVGKYIVYSIDVPHPSFHPIDPSP